MKREKSFRVFVIYALLFQFAIIASMNRAVKDIGVTTINDYKPRTAVVQVIVGYRSLSIPESGGPGYTGTGTAIAIDENKVFILTARHVCLPMPSEIANQLGLIQQTEILDSTGEYYPATIVAAATIGDLCVISYETPDASALTTAGISDRPSYLDENVSMYAAPAGFYTPSSIAQFTGIHAGSVRLVDGVSSVYTIPATGGSSGASILGSNGKIVGVLHSTLADFHHVSLASTYEGMIDFLFEVESYTGVNIID